MVVCSGGREMHVCPFGQLIWMRSKDNGVTWSWPQVLYDGPIDDRDAGVVETVKGTILVTNFTSLAYEPILLKAEKAKPGEAGYFSDPKRLAAWQSVHNQLLESQRKAEFGTYMFRSTDGGITWSSRYAVPVNSPHGPIVLRDGRLIYPGKSFSGDGKIGVCESTDDGLTWSWLGTIPAREGDDFAKYHELHGVEAQDGTIICHIRNENAKDDGETMQCESTDGGKTWTIPHRIGIWGIPSHLLRLKDGRLLMSYGYRRKPFGNHARISGDNGKTWGEPLILSDDGIGGDLGYPSTIECDDGSLVTVWYEVLAGSPFSQLRQARWKLQ
jgi:sialidase-1